MSQQYALPKHAALLVVMTEKKNADSEIWSGIGGLAGAAIHPLALGNVRIIRSMLDEHEQLKRISIIGVGGVFDRGGYTRMLAVGAEAVGLGTGLGKEGIGVFPKILKDVEKMDEEMEAIQDEECLFSTKRARLNNYPATDIQVPPRRDELHPQLQNDRNAYHGIPQQLSDANVELAA